MGQALKSIYYTHLIYHYGQEGSAPGSDRISLMPD